MKFSILDYNSGSIGLNAKDGKRVNHYWPEVCTKLEPAPLNI